MKKKLTPEQAAKEIARLKRKITALQAEGVKYRQSIWEQKSYLSQLLQDYKDLERNSERLLAKQAAEILELKEYIKKLKA